jgi:uncharacterized protein (DUF1499 family)
MEFTPFFGVAFFCSLLFMMGFSRMDAQQQVPANPLPECPDSPNCTRESFYFERTAADIFELAQATLKDMDAETIEVVRTPDEGESGELKAVFRIPIVGFRDDVVIAVVPAGGSGQDSWLHIRSASRTGYSDLGVNARRVNTFRETLRKRIES